MQVSIFDPNHAIGTGTGPGIVTVYDGGASVEVKSGSNQDADFAARCSAPGVIRFNGFNSVADLNGKRAVACGGSKVDFETTVGTDPKQGNTQLPQLDPSVKCSGASSLKFTYLSQSGEAAAGRFYTNFSADCTALFGPTTETRQMHFGDEFYVQWAQMFSPEILETVFLVGTGGSITDQKLAIITAGDVPPGWQTIWPNGKNWGDCEKIEVPVSRHGNNRFPFAYNECGAYTPFETRMGNGVFNWQNAMPAPYCLSSTVLAMGGNFNTHPIPGCFNYEPGIWYTHQAGFTLGPRDRTTRRFTNSTFKLWIGKKGQTCPLIIDWNPGVNGYFALCDGYPDTNGGPQWFGAVVLEPYMSQKDVTQIHPSASTWIDELIISRQRIADPLV